MTGSRHAPAIAVGVLALGDDGCIAKPDADDLAIEKIVRPGP